ncbi:hypothetical protein DEJ50_00970 [Streptomyces venezuelae]|uniref:Uncharacterized protein n=1 Tax=Streptomyces venezuelae TaxID=54571 RepID=A0A5P2CUM3_STRVZ|nr:hypothetical protein DEJ50_00970 [Streptomyces venezuelae]
MCTIAPAGAAVQPAGTAETVVSCGNSGLQAGLATRVCAAITGTTVEFYGTVGLAGPPTPGSPAPSPRELMTTLTSEVVGSGAPETQNKRVIFTASTIEVHGLVSNVPCGSTVRGSFGVASFPWTPNPVTHQVTVAC